MYKDTVNLKVDQKRCCKCGLCLEDCRNRAIIAGPDGFPVVDPVGGTDRCMHCHHCMMICPTAALSVDGVDPVGCFPAKQDLPSYESLLDLVRSRRSCRDYLQKNVDKNVIADLMDAMRYVPTGVNRRGLYFSVIDDIQVMEEYRCKTYEKICAMKKAGTLPEGQNRLYEQFMAGGDPVFRTAPHLLIVSVAEDSFCAEADPLIAVSYFELLAHAHGLGTVWFGRWMSMWRTLLPEMIQPMNIPRGYRPGYAILFGYASPKQDFVRTGNPDAVPIATVSAEDVKEY
ncbi:MAG: nitroreductase family protein [Lentisphaeria bacterium]|nr:nitroreductase family protein [Lentisphaeria bacterium]